jgi:hypothetical protein
VSTFAGLFLCAFGALGAWFLAKRFPAARFLRGGYLLMSLGGALFVVWTLTHRLPIGIAAASVMALGAIVGTIGALRKELRFSP